MCFKKYNFREQLIILFFFISYSTLAFSGLYSFVVELDKLIYGQKSLVNVRKIEKSNGEYQLFYSFNNNFNNKTYHRVISIDLLEYQSISNNNNIEVLYPRFFPSEDVVVGVNSKKSVVIVLYLVITLVLFYGLHQVILVISGKTSLKNYLGVQKTS